MTMTVDEAFERSYAARRRRLDARHDVELEELAVHEHNLEDMLEEEQWGFSRMQDVTMRASAREGASFQRIAETLYDYLDDSRKVMDSLAEHREQVRYERRKVEKAYDDSLRSLRNEWRMKEAGQ